MNNETQNISGINVKDAVDNARNLGERISTQVEKVSRKIESELGGVKLTEATIPDAFNNMPKLISPRVHAWLDVAVTSYFVTLGVVFARRRQAGPAIAAFVNAGMVAGVSALTDYEGKGKKPISFKLHGSLDALQAATAAIGPLLHGFASEPEAAFFYGQAANELAVIASTDWDEGMPRKKKMGKAA